MSKIKTIILDFDNTMVDTTTAVCGAYNELYKSEPGFEPVKITGTTVYYMASRFLPLVHGWSPELFKSEIFFEKVKPFPDSVDVLKKLIEEYGYRIIVCSYGTYENIIEKCKYIPKVFPFINEFIPVIGTSSKSIIDMSDAYFIDDFPPNLISSKAYPCNRAHRFSHYTYLDFDRWMGPIIPNYKYMEKLFTKLLLEKEFDY